MKIRSFINCFVSLLMLTLVPPIDLLNASSRNGEIPPQVDEKDAAKLTTPEPRKCKLTRKKTGKSSQAHVSSMVIQKKEKNPPSPHSREKTRERSSSEPIDIETSPKASPPNRKSSLPVSSKPTILVVEDSPVARTILIRLINQYFSQLDIKPSEYVIIPVETAEDAIEAHRINNPFITFLDYNLKGELTGLDVITSIRERNRQYGFQISLGIFVGISGDSKQNGDMKLEYNCPKPIQPHLIREILATTYINSLAGVDDQLTPDLTTISLYQKPILGEVSSQHLEGE